MKLQERKLAQYLTLSEGLKRLPGSEFEKHRHPAVVLDRATGPDVRVWGWWSGGDTELPCLLWTDDQGWSATVVEPDAFDSEGYERVFWSHRIKLLDLALANAIGPCKKLADLELRVAGDTSYGLDAAWADPHGALLWGIVQLRAARAHRGHIVGGARVCMLPTTPDMHGVMDEELARYGLVPTLPKRRMLSRAPDFMTGRTVPGSLGEPVLAGSAPEE